MWQSVIRHCSARRLSSLRTPASFHRASTQALLSNRILPVTRELALTQHGSVAKLRWRAFSAVAPSFQAAPFDPAPQRKHLGGSRIFSLRRLTASTGVEAEVREEPFEETLSVVKSISEFRADPYNVQKPKTTTFKVVEVSADGTVMELVKTPFEMHLQPRDVSLFTSDPRLAKQRATIAARDGSILFCTETCKAIIQSQRATLFHLRHHQDTVRLVENVLSRVTQVSAVPFEFRVLETMLEATTVYFEKRTKQVRLLLESVVADITAQHRTDANVSEFQRSLQALGSPLD